MKINKFLASIGTIAIGLAQVSAGDDTSELELTRNGQTDYVIIESAETTPAEKYSAQELSEYMAKITGAKFKVLIETATPYSSNAIYVGKTNYAAKQGIDFAGLGDEEWVIKSVGKNIILTGGRPRGTIYAVYEFLEQQLGCHWFDELTERIPSQVSLKLKALSIQGKPTFIARQIYTGKDDSSQTMALRARNKDTRGTQTDKFGFGQNTCIHSFYAYSKDFPADHPEYLAMNINGERPMATNGSGPGQICLTNPNARMLVLEKLKANIANDRKLAANAKDGRNAPQVYYLCPNDAPWNCQCKECKAFIEKEDADSGPLIDFVNFIADRIKDEYPDILVGTFAYANNIKTPKNIRPRDNVLIAVCQLNAEWISDSAADKDEYPDLFRPMTAPINSKACETLRTWSKISKHGEYWDYWIQYAKDKFPSPYVNIHCIGLDLRLFRDCKIKKFFTEYENPETTSFHALTCWIGWKLMQNPDQDTTPLIKTFMDGYYGTAAGKMSEYLNYMQYRITAVPEKAGKMSAMTPSQRPYLDLDFYLTSQRLLDDAEKLCGTDAALLLKVQRERIPVDSGLYCMWEQLEKQLPQGQSMPWKSLDILKRYKNNRLAQINTYHPEKLSQASDALNREILNLQGIAAKRKGENPPIIIVPKQTDERATGNPSEINWSKAVTYNKWHTLVGNEQPERKIKSAFMHDSKYLYILLEEQDITPSKLSKVWWVGDGWELFFTTKKSGSPYKQLAINPDGKHNAYDYEKAHKAWDFQGTIKSDISNNCWRTTIAIPLKSLMSSEDFLAERPLFINIFRTTPAPGFTMALSPIYEAGFSDMTRLAELRLEMDWPDAKTNLALGKSYKLSKNSDYMHCKNPAADTKKLTDGNFAKNGSPIWFDKENTVGFCGSNVEMTFDLEKTVQISKIFFHTAAGCSSVEAPKCIKVYVSEDGKNYSLAGEETPEPSGESGYKVFTVGIPVNKASGRYVRINLQSGNYIFCDEVAITGESSP